MPQHGCRRGRNLAGGKFFAQKLRERLVLAVEQAVFLILTASSIAVCHAEAGHAQDTVGKKPFNVHIARRPHLFAWRRVPKADMRFNAEVASMRRERAFVAQGPE